MHIAIIGKHFSGFRTYLENNKIEYTVFKDARSIPKNPQANTYYIDFSDEQAVISMIKIQHAHSPFTAVVTLFEQYIVLAAQTAQELGLPGLPVDAAVACTDKSIMRQRFATAPKKVSPDFQKVSSWKEVEAFANTHQFPLILKPANLAKSLLVTKNHDMNELRASYDKMQHSINAVYEKYAPRNERIALIEEFLEGSIHSVDAFVDNQGNPTILPYIVDYQTGYDIGYDDNFHYSRIVPSALSPAAQVDFMETAELAIRSLGMRNTAAHVEIIVTKDGARMVEIGARNGGYRERLHGLAHGINIYGNLLRTIAGKPVDVSHLKEEPCAVLELFPKTAGTFVALAHEAQLRTLPSLQYLSIKHTVGSFAGKSSEGYKASCVIVLHHTDTAQFNKDLEFVNSHVYIQTSRS